MSTKQQQQQLVVVTGRDVNLREVERLHEQVFHDASLATAGFADEQQRTVSAEEYGADREETLVLVWREDDAC